MEIITMILSGLALLAASVSLILTIKEKKRNEKRNAAALQYADAAAAKAIAIADKKAEEARTALYKNIHEKYEKRISDLENGIVPDYNEALAAKNSVDEFNKGLSAIMGFDPLEAARKARQRNQYGGEVE